MSAEVMVRQQSRSRSVVYCAAAIACMAVTAWVTVPIGPVPLSLSPLAIFFTLFALKPRDAFIAICGYVALGAIGLPVFTGFRGGIGALFGPTGGFIMGFVVGACIVFGWLWLMWVGQLTAEAAFVAAVAPFVVPDLLKMLLAVFLAQAVGAAQSRL